VLVEQTGATQRVNI